MNCVCALASGEFSSLSNHPIGSASLALTTAVKLTDPSLAVSDSSNRRARTVQDSLRDHEPLARREFDRPILEVDEKLAFDHIEELVVLIVLVPVVFAFDHAEPHHGAIHLAERLVVPLEFASVGERLGVDQLERLEREVQPGFVRVRW